MFYLDILIGFSLVMLVFASGVSVVQSMIKRLFAVKGRSIIAPLLDELEQQWKVSPLGDADGRMWARIRDRLEADMKSRANDRGGMLAHGSVDDAQIVLAALNASAMREMPDMVREMRSAPLLPGGRPVDPAEEWARILGRVEKGWDRISGRLKQLYTRNTRASVFVISLLAAAIFNVDAIKLLRVLSVDGETRRALAVVAAARIEREAAADVAVDATADGATGAPTGAVAPPADPSLLPTQPSVNNVDHAAHNPDHADPAAAARRVLPRLPASLSEWQRDNAMELAGTGLPLGWERTPLRVCYDASHRRAAGLFGQACGGGTNPGATFILWLVRIFGLLIGAGLIAQGAPFWYSVIDSVTGIKKRVTTVAAEPTTAGKIGRALEQIAAAAGTQEPAPLPAPAPAPVAPASPSAAEAVPADVAVAAAAEEDMLIEHLPELSSSAPEAPAAPLYKGPGTP